MLAVARTAGLAPHLSGVARAGLPGPAGAPHPHAWRRSILLGTVMGTAYFAGTLYWIAEVMVTFGGLARPVAVLVNALLVGFLALFPGIAFFGVGVAATRLGPPGLLLAPVFWVASELAREHLLGGFPWVLLGYSQTTVLPVAQLASVFGVYGLSGLVAFVSVACAHAFVGRDRAGAIVLGAAGAAVIVTGAWGAWRIGEAGLLRAGEPIRVGLVQGNIAQEEKWDPRQRPRILRTYLEMTRAAAAEGARLIIWPESSTPFFFEEDAAGAEAIRTLAAEQRVYLLFGSDQIERGPEELRIFNASFLLRPDGQTAEVYRKIHLVPFGEYVPFRQVLFFAAPLVESVADFSPGTAPVTLPVEGRRISTAICYEVVYPSLIRRFVHVGSEVLTTITNDAWYGRSSAPHQHFEQAAMRAIEQGRYLARAANTGVSGRGDPYGRVTARSDIFEPAVLVGDVRFITARTIYGRIGDAFAYACAILSVATLLAALRVRRPWNLGNHAHL